MREEAGHVQMIFRRLHNYIARRRSIGVDELCAIRTVTEIAKKIVRRKMGRNLSSGTVLHRERNTVPESAIGF